MRATSFLAFVVGFIIYSSPVQVGALCQIMSDTDIARLWTYPQNILLYQCATCPSDKNAGVSRIP